MMDTIHLIANVSCILQTVTLADVTISEKLVMVAFKSGVTKGQNYLLKHLSLTTSSDIHQTFGKKGWVVSMNWHLLRLLY